MIHPLFYYSLSGVTALSVRGQSVFSAGNDGMVMGWEPRSPLNQMTELPGEPASTAISPDGSMVVTGFADGSLRFYSLPESDLLTTLENVHKEDIQRLAFSPDSVLTGIWTRL
ncbi:MAG: hypothetical protein GY847_39310 [Proteobacteria bacterium]|nr:hypothetical protein [Pseudomonadota bacterium]